MSLINRCLALNGTELTLLRRREAAVAPTATKAAVQQALRLLRPWTVNELPLRRLGSSGDGGYLVPDDLKGLTCCFSPGVSTNSSFEFDCAELGMEVFMADYSVDGPAAQHPHFHFIKKYLACYESDIFITLDKWIGQSGSWKADSGILQIDIEGAEWEVLLHARKETLETFRIIVVEFHDVEQIWNRAAHRLMHRALEKLNETHVPVHLHVNNLYPVFSKHGLAIPPLLEVTYYLRSRVRSLEAVKSLPHPADSDNVPGPSIPVPESLWK